MGEDALNSDPEIPELAEIVARVLRFAVGDNYYRASHGL